jgi:endonuclease/exonuclease/phosphatase family metal-dependent hydrolase
MRTPLLRATSTVLAAALAATLATTVPARAAGTQGTGPGSQPNGRGNLHVSLARTSDGTITVSWKRPTEAAKLEKFVVKVGVNRRLDNLVKSYAVSPTAQSLVVPPAYGVLPDSGNYTFVKVVVHRRSGQVGASPTKWIEAPILSRCTAARDDRVTVGTFNIRNWLTEERKRNKRYPWTVRRANVIHQILHSGAHAVAIQEASGPENHGFGGLEQDEYLLRRLNAKDPDKNARWRYALSDAAYRNPGGRPGLKGTRVYYDRNKFRLLDSGLFRLPAPGLPSDSLMPWARLQAVDGRSAPFVLTSSHLDQGEDRASWGHRTHQIAQTADHVLELYNRFGDQVIVAGDLNETANTNPYNQAQLRLLEIGMFDAFATRHRTNAAFPTTNGLSFPVRRTPNRRDYILTYGSVRGSCSYKNVVFRRPAQASSDHFMQVATLPLPPS